MDSFLKHREFHKLGRSKSCDSVHFSLVVILLKINMNFRTQVTFPKGQLKKFRFCLNSELIFISLHKVDGYKRRKELLRWSNKKECMVKINYRKQIVDLIHSRR